MEEKIIKVDLRRIGIDQLNPKEDAYKAIGQHLHEAFSLCGFAYLQNHGVPSDQSADMFNASRRFFADLDLDKKRKYPRSQITHHGFLEQDMELLGTEERAHEYRETYNVTSVTKSDHVFPDDEVPEFRENVRTLFRTLRVLNRRLLKALAYALNVDPDYFQPIHDKMFEDGNLTTFRACYYPPLEGSVPPNSIRCNEHSDYGLLTFLFQDNLGGLQIKNRMGEWIDATPIPGTIMVNIGDLLEIYTNGQFPATPHRVVIPEDESIRRQARYSFILFIVPNDDATVAPLNGERPKKEEYETTTPLQHILNMFSKTIETKQEIKD